MNEVIADIKKEDVADFSEIIDMFTTNKPFNAVENRKKMRNGEL